VESLCEGFICLNGQRLRSKVREHRVCECPSCGVKRMLRGDVWEKRGAIRFWGSDDPCRGWIISEFAAKCENDGIMVSWEWSWECVVSKDRDLRIQEEVVQGCVDVGCVGVGVSERVRFGHVSCIGWGGQIRIPNESCHVE